MIFNTTQVMYILLGFIIAENLYLVAYYFIKRYVTKKYWDEYKDNME